MNKVILTGVAALVVGSALEFVLPFLGIQLDLARFLDGSITLGEIVWLAGSILVIVSNQVRSAARSAVRNVRMALGLKTR